MAWSLRCEFVAIFLRSGPKVSLRRRGTIKWFCSRWDDINPIETGLGNYFPRFKYILLYITRVSHRDGPQQKSTAPNCVVEESQGGLGEASAPPGQSRVQRRKAGNYVRSQRRALVRSCKKLSAHPWAGEPSTSLRSAFAAEAWPNAAGAGQKRGARSPAFAGQLLRTPLGPQRPAFYPERFY